MAKSKKQGGDQDPKKGSKKRGESVDKTLKLPKSKLDELNNPKGGRPEAIIDEALLFELARIQCTQVEMAACLGVSRQTLITHLREHPELADTLERGQAAGKMSLRRHMFHEAQKGNAIMQIFLSKNLLGMSDKVEHTVNDIPNSLVDLVENMTDEELIRELGIGQKPDTPGA